MEIWLNKTLTALLLPPGISLVIGVAGLALLPWRRRLGLSVLALALLTLYLFSLPVLARAFLHGLEFYPPLVPSVLRDRPAGAIVVLASNRYSRAPEYAGDTVGAETLVRLRYAARLQRQTGLPLLVSGGTVFGAGVPLADLMRKALLEDLGVPVRWVERESWNTYENAARSRALLSAAGVEAIVLVTHAWHMPRAVEAFEHLGMRVLPAPTEFTSEPSGDRGLVDWLPSAGALRASARAAHEHIGRLWYRLRYYR